MSVFSGIQISRIITLILIYTFLILSFSSKSYGESPYSWYTFNIPPFGSVSERGIGYVLANTYIEAGLENEIFLVNAARWRNDMLDSKNMKFCSTGSWKLPDTSHRVYSDSILNTVDYGVAVRPELYKRLSNNGKKRVVSILDVIEATESAKHMLIMNGRPVFGKMGEIIEDRKQESGTHIRYMPAYEGRGSIENNAKVSTKNGAKVWIIP